MALALQRDDPQEDGKCRLYFQRFINAVFRTSPPHDPQTTDRIRFPAGAHTRAATGSGCSQECWTRVCSCVRPQVQSHILHHGFLVGSQHAQHPHCWRDDLHDTSRLAVLRRLRSLLHVYVSYFVNVASKQCLTLYSYLCASVCYCNNFVILRCFDWQPCISLFFGLEDVEGDHV